MTDQTDETDCLSVYSDDIMETLQQLDEEFNGVIHEMMGMQEQHDQIIDTLCALQSRPVEQSGIYIIQDDVRRHFSECIETIHDDSLLEIEQHGHSTFCDRLLQFIETSTFMITP